jgi:hypothetical protein
VWGHAPLALFAAVQRVRCGEGLVPVVIDVLQCNITRRYDLSGTARRALLYLYSMHMGVCGVACT